MSNLDKRDDLARRLSKISDEIKRHTLEVAWFTTREWLQLRAEAGSMLREYRRLRAELAALEAPTLASLGLAEWEVPGV